jgi:hypothetical protein
MRKTVFVSLLVAALFGCSEPKSNYLPMEIDEASVTGDVVAGA